MMRLRITFEKTDAMRFTGHLDLHRTLERTIRRAKLPLAYSQGFNPKPKFNLAAALPLGFTGEGELGDIWFAEDQPVNFIIDCLQKASPPGIKVRKGEIINLQEPKLPNIVISSEYIVKLIRPIKDLSDRIKRIKNIKTIIRERRGKEYDLKPLIISIEEVELSPNGEQQFSLHLSSLAGATGRPDEVIKELGIPYPNTRVHRQKLLIKSRN